MSYSAATFPGVTAFDRRASAGPGYRRAVARSVSIGVGTVTTAGLMAGTAAVAAAWLVATTLHGAPHMQAHVPLRFAGSPERQRVDEVFADLAAASRHAETAVVAAVAPPIEAERAKAARLPLIFGRVPLPRPRVDEGEREFAALASQGQIAGAPRDVDEAPPSGQVAAAFDVFSAPPTFGTPSYLPAPAHTPVTTAARTPSPASVNSPPPLRLADAGDVPPPLSLNPPAPSLNPSLRPADAANPKTASPRVAALTPEPSRLGGFLHRLFGPRDTSPSVASVDGHTAVYDITAHVVYLPNGEALEAHSGLGAKMDDPHYVNEKDRGATPPNVYNLVLRESSFHGVQAIRLNPVDDDKMYGRAGILAHPYMLGASGQSFGCVSFKDYNAFLRAFEQGEVNRMVVVSHLDGKLAEAAPAPAPHKAYKHYAVND